MLTYTYECDHCGEFEHRQSITESALECCPECGGEVQRLISGGAGFITKGGGGKGSFGGSCSQAAGCGHGGHCGSCKH